MKSLTLTALLLTAPGLAAQELRSGPNAPATSAQIPPTDPAQQRTPGPDQPGAAPGDTNARTGADDARTSPPADHRVLGGPPVPGAQRAGESEGFAPRADPIPSNIGEQNRSGASTTGR
jgi:hypothetical protein